MNEAQVIDDILNQLYNYDIIFKSGDKELIQKKKREKNEKQEELIKQIELMCSILEKELRNEMGEAFFEVKKGLRTFVIDSIQKEIKNGNTVIGSDGKISLKKFSMKILSQKNEIINKPQKVMMDLNEETERESVIEEIDKKVNVKFEIEQLFEKYGIDLSEEEKEIIVKSITTVESIFEEYKKRIEAGENAEDVIDDIVKRINQEEKGSSLIGDIERVAGYHALKFLDNNKKYYYTEDLQQKITHLNDLETNLEIKNITTTIQRRKDFVLQNGEGANAIYKSLDEDKRYKKEVDDFSERMCFFRKVYERIEPELKTEYEESALPKDKEKVEIRTQKGITATNKIFSLLESRLQDGDPILNQKTNEIANQAISFFTAKVEDKERKNQENYDVLKEALDKTMEDRSEEILVSNSLQSVMEIADIHYKKDQMDVILHSKDEKKHDQPGEGDFLKMRGMKTYLNNHLTGELAKYGIETLGQAAKDGVIVEKTESSKTQDSTEVQTPESGLGEPEDEVK